MRMLPVEVEETKLSDLFNYSPTNDHCIVSFKDFEERPSKHKDGNTLSNSDHLHFIIEDNKVKVRYHYSDGNRKFNVQESLSKLIDLVNKLYVTEVCSEVAKMYKLKPFQVLNLYKSNFGCTSVNEDTYKLCDIIHNAENADKTFGDLLESCIYHADLMYHEIFYGIPFILIECGSYTRILYFASFGKFITLLSDTQLTPLMEKYEDILRYDFYDVPEDDEFDGEMGCY